MLSRSFLVMSAAAFGACAWDSERVQNCVAYELYLDDPEMMTRAGVGKGAWWDLWSSRLSDSSPARTEKLIARKRRLLDRLEGVLVPSPGTNERLSHDIVEWYLRREVAGEPFAYHDYLVDSYGGVQSSVLELITELHPLDTYGGVEAYINRLQRLPEKVAGILASLELRRQRGIVAPSWSLEKVAAAIERFVATPPERNVLYTALVSRTAAGPSMGADERQMLLAQTLSAISQDVYPAYHKLLETVRQMQTESVAGDGVWRLPDGAAYYQHLLETYTTTHLSADELHSLGLREVSRLQAELDAALKALGLEQGTPAERMRQLASDPERVFPAGEQGREQLLEAYRQRIAIAKAGVARVFDVLPTGDIDVRPEPPFQEATADAAHGVIRGRDMVLFINTAHPNMTPRYAVQSLVFHETIPGHFIQRSIQRSMSDVPLIRKFLPFTAFSEGWAMYSERLAFELGLAPDPYDNLGRIQSELWRAVRLVVDTGIHHDRWSRAQAIEYYASVTGQPNEQVVAEVERYILQPGQACAYMVGMLRFLALRDAARASLGERFHYSDLHREMLKNGAMPLDILEAQIRAWIAFSQQGKNPGVTR